MPAPATAPASALAASASAPASAAASAPAATSAPQDGGPGNNLRGGPNDVHALLLDEAAEVFSRGATEEATIEVNPPGVAIPKPRTAGATADQPRLSTYTSRAIETEFPFNDLVPSWNVDLPEGTGVEAEIRLGRKADGSWTPYYYFGVWGTAPKPDRRIIKDDHGVIDIDTFRSSRSFDRIQYKFLLATTVPDRSPVIRRVGLAYSNTLNDAALAARFRKPIDSGPPSGWARRLPVPWRSQTVEDEKIRHSVCSPTSVSMVLQYYGVTRPTAEVAAAIYDRHYRVYGNWIRAVQAAYGYGVTGYLERFGDWDAVKRHIAAGRPVIASIRAEQGEIRHAPYRSTDGHLIVIVGFDQNGNLHINDPAAKTIEAGVATYFKEDMQKIWLDHGGVGYVLTGPVKR
ncbi:MAG: C39 family peptidase [Planctomycetes bacterium]|nr:C39 family peptidase [Planctomycetota bacterium]